MENYIVINGKKAELTQEQLKALGLEREINPFARAGNGERYYYINNAGIVSYDTDCHTIVDKTLFNVGNYCTDEAIMQQRAYMEMLNRLLWRYSMEHKGDEIDWDNLSQYKYYIYCDDEKQWRVHVVPSEVYFFGVFFYSRETAEAAITEIIEPFMAEHPDFKPF